MRAVLGSCVLLGVSSPVAAYDVMTTGSGAPVRWGSQTVKIELSMNEPPTGVDLDASQEAAVQAVFTWSEPLGVELELDVVSLGGRANSGNDGRNVLRWVTEQNDERRDPDALATTRVTYNSRTGAVTDADIVVNAVDYTWAVVDGDCEGRVFDLENTLAHEMGHLLGLTHAADYEATMFPSSGACETLKRDLTGDDRFALEYLYEQISAPSDSYLGVAGCSAAEGLSSSPVLLLLLLAFADVSRRGPTQRRSTCSHAVLVGAMGFVTVFFAESSAHAGGAVAWDVPELNRRADIAFVGTVSHQQVRWLGGRLVTESEVKVEECWRGLCRRATVTLQQEGGELGEVGQIVVGSTPLSLGERAVVYGRHLAGVARPLGFDQGVFRAQNVAKETRWMRRSLSRGLGHELGHADAARTAEYEQYSLAELRSGFQASN